MKHIKKRIAALLAAALCIALTGCAAPSTSTASLETSSVTSEGETVSAPEKNPANYDSDLQGLCKFFEDSALVAGDRVQMSFDVIGAENGYKYAFRYNESNVQVELYAFGDEMSETAQAVVDSVLANGSFEVLGNTVPGILSADNRYLMIYTDTKAGNDDTSKAHYERALACFNTFTAAAE